ncbi:LysR family transcriptional regulator [Hydrogenophaga crocea]|uniref:LysR family transcriptional regulator n=1 Tax=Hydrogenophaga crocea TaxID=2716225 RepID=A0A6G8IER7_9BURK|nr:LysR family transcriptional regulator [Hydrogenophaga crocea]QIM51516.1 LysR family transcriptional regulator [Hydrogenophaga crocea]
MKESPLAGDRLELLQTFVRIVESGSLSAAAQRLDTTQPTVSRRLQALERHFGVRLLHRSTHAVTLTPDGERCLAMARALIDEWEALQESLRGPRSAASGTLKVLVPHALGQTQLVAPLARYLRAHPGVRVEWLLSDRHPDFVAEGIDCAVQVGEISDPKLVALPLYELPRIVIGSPALLGGRPVPRTPEALRALPWLALQTFYRDDVVLSPVGGGAAQTIAIRPRLSTDSLYALRSAALEGLGAAVVSAWMVSEELRDGRLLHLAPGWAATPLPVHLVYPYARFQPARLKRFLEVFKAHGPQPA